MMRCRWPMLLASLSVVVAVVVAATAVAITNTDAVDAKVVVGTTSTAATTTTTEVVATRDMSLSVTCSDPHKAHRNDTATANEPATTDGPPSSTKKTTEELRKRVEQLTNDLSKASALLEISKQREKQLIVLEKEKYNYVKEASDTVMRLVDNVQHVENRLASDTYREQQIQHRLALTYQTLSRSSHRLQVVRRLLAGSEVGLVHMESNRKLNPYCSNTENPQPRPNH